MAKAELKAWLVPELTFDSSEGKELGLMWDPMGDNSSLRGAWYVPAAAGVEDCP